MVKASQNITENIHNLIKTEFDQVGLRLPSERELCERFSVSRSSVREALRELETIGMLEKQPRSGTYVRDPNVELGGLLELGRVSAEDIEKIFEMRMLLEPGCASLAAERAKPAHVRQLQTVLAQMQRYCDDGDRQGFTQADALFHQTITDATQNDHLIRLVESIMLSLEHSLNISLQVPGQMERAIVGHEQILKAIEGKQNQWAAAAMESHLRDAWFYIERIMEEKP